MWVKVGLYRLLTGWNYTRPSRSVCNHISHIRLGLEVVMVVQFEQQALVHQGLDRFS